MLYVFDLRMIFLEIFYLSPVFSFTFTRNTVNSAVMCLPDNFLPIYGGLTGKHHITWHSSSISVSVGWGFNQGIMQELTNDSIRAFVSSSAQVVWSVTYQRDIPVTHVSTVCYIFLLLNKSGGFIKSIQHRREGEETGNKSQKCLKTCEDSFCDTKLGVIFPVCCDVQG